MLRRDSLLATRSGFRPLAMHDDGILGYERGNLILVDYDLKLKHRVSQILYKSVWHRIASRFRIFERVLRLSPSTGIIFDRKLYVAHRDTIVKYSLDSGESSVDFIVPQGRGVLAFNKISVSGAEWLVFGEYFSNPDRREVSVWAKRAGDSGWIKSTSFSEGEIEHIHNVVQIRDRILVLAGDFDKAAGIWHLDFEAGRLCPLARGKQSYRICWAHDGPEGLLTASDTQLQINHLQLLALDRLPVESTKLAELPGSSIYSCSDGVRVVFSTVVEPGVVTGNAISTILDTRPGPGIREMDSSIFVLNRNGKLGKVFSARKDWLPMRLAQFGTFAFPTGDAPADRCFAYGQAVEKWDGVCLALSTSDA